MTNDVIVTYLGGFGPPAAYADIPRVTPVEMYALADTTFERAAAILIGFTADQYELQRLSTRLEDYLARGGAVFACGHVAHPWLSLLRPFEPLSPMSVEAMRVRVDASHPLYTNVDANDLTFRRGVAGFYGRGANPPPPSARVVATLGGGSVPLDWEILVGAGRLYVHAGLDPWNYTLTTDGSARRLAPQVLDWVDTRRRA
jgi:hypothetical protein